MINTAIDRKSVERPCPNCGVTLNGHSVLRHCGTYISHDRSTCIRYLRDALDEAEAERHRWRQAASIGSVHTQADLDRAVAEARAVALEEAAEIPLQYEPCAAPDAIRALIDTPAAEALERVRAEEREACAKVAYDGGCGWQELRSSALSSSWPEDAAKHLASEHAAFAIAAAIRARTEGEG